MKVWASLTVVVKVLANLVSGAGAPPGLGLLPACWDLTRPGLSLQGKRDHEPPCPFLFLPGHHPHQIRVPILRASLKVLSPRIVAQRAGLQHRNFREAQFSPYRW